MGLAMLVATVTVKPLFPLFLTLTVLAMVLSVSDPVWKRLGLEQSHRTELEMAMRKERVADLGRQAEVVASLCWADDAASNDAVSGSCTIAWSDHEAREAQWLCEAVADK